MSEGCGGSPFHAGERALQEQAGLRDKMEAIGRRVLRDYMPDQHREFFAGLPFLALATLDGAGQPWASLVTGSPGFASTPDARTLRIDARPRDDDPASAHIGEGRDIGILGIDFSTRRRNRANGLIRVSDARGFTVAVTQSFGNCPKYIQAREWSAAERAARTLPVTGTALGTEERALIAAADTFFIASAAGSAREPGHGADVSHRGGKPGFVRVESDRQLAMPDYPGNSYFNTLGNLVVESRAGLLFLDFETGTTLQLAVRAEISAEGTARLVRFKVAHWIRCDGALPLRWRFREYSPFLERL